MMLLILFSIECQQMNYIRFQEQAHSKCNFFSIEGSTKSKCKIFVEFIVYFCHIRKGRDDVCVWNMTIQST